MYKFHVRAHTTVNEVRARLSEVGGVRVASILPARPPVAARLRRRWLWPCVASAWAALFAASVAVPGDPLEHMINLQAILLYSGVAMAIAAWAYRSGRKGAQYASRRASALVIGA